MSPLDIAAYGVVVLLLILLGLAAIGFAAIVWGAIREGLDQARERRDEPREPWSDRR